MVTLETCPFDEPTKPYVIKKTEKEEWCVQKIKYNLSAEMQEEIIKLIRKQIKNRRRWG